MICYLKLDEPIFIFSVLLFITLVFPPLFSKLRLPSIVGLIIAGVIIGPNALKIIKDNSSIILISKIGLLYIMFLAGLEIDVFQVKNKVSNTIVYGFFTFAIPLIMGILAGYFILKMNILSALLLASMFSSHTLLTYPIVSKLGLSKNSTVTSTISGTIITDILAILILAVVAGTAKQEITILYWLKFGLFLLIYTISVIFLIPKISKLFFKTSKKDDSLEYIFVLFILLLCGYLAYIAGLEPIIGAFLAGLIFNYFIPKNSVLMNRIHFIGNTIFIPIFLIHVGMIIDIKIFFSGNKAILVSLLMIFLAITSKFIASFLSKFILKWSTYEAWLSYGMSVNQAAATLAAVLVGYELKFFDDTILSGTIAMILVTCFLGSIITDFFAKKIVLFEEKKVTEEITFHNLRIMVPISNKNNIKDLMELAFILHKKYSTEYIYPINIVIDNFNVEKELLNAEKLVSLAVAESIAANVNVTPITRIDINIAEGLLKVIRDLRIDCLIYGWDGKKSSITKIFSYAIDPIIENSNQLIIINKIVNSFRFYNRMLLIIPPLIEKQNGYEETFYLVQHIAEQLHTPITLITSKETILKSDNILKKIKNILNSPIIEVKEWKELTNILDSNVKDFDIITLLSTRITTLAWQPLLNKLPGILSTKYSKNNMMVIFPFEEKEEQNIVQDDSSLTFKNSILKKENIYLNLHKYKIDEVFRLMLSKNFSSNSETLKRLSSFLLDIFYNDPVQLLDDVILVHAHISEIDDFIVYVGVNNNGFDIPKLNANIKIIIVLLNSVERSTEHHLNLLKEIALLIKNEKFITALRTSKSLKELEKNIKENN